MKYGGKWSPRLVAVCVVLLLGGQCYAQFDDKSYEHPNGKGVLFRVSRPESNDTSYILALLAMQDEPAFSFPDTALTLMKRCTSYVAFIHPDDGIVLGQKALFNRRMDEWFSSKEPRSKSLISVFDQTNPDAYPRRLRSPDYYLGEYARRQGLRLKSVTKSSVAKNVNPRFDANNILTLAPEYGAEQDVVKYLLEQYAEGNLDDMHTRWMSLITIATANQANDEIMPGIIRAVEGYSSENPCFFALPSLYLGGRGGVLAGLRKRGFTVEAVSNSAVEPIKFASNDRPDFDETTVQSADGVIRITLPFAVVDNEQNAKDVKVDGEYFYSLDNRQLYSVEVVYKHDSYESVQQYADSIIRAVRRRKPDADLEWGKAKNDDNLYSMFRDKSTTPPFIGGVFIKTPVSVIYIEYCLPSAEATEKVLHSLEIARPKRDSVWYELLDSATQTRCWLPGRAVRRHVWMDSTSSVAETVLYSTNTIDIHNRQVDYEIIDLPTHKRRSIDCFDPSIPGNFSIWPVRTVGEHQVFEYITDKTTTALVLHGTACYVLHIADKKTADVLIVDRWASSLTFSDSPLALEHSCAFPGGILSLRGPAKFRPIEEATGGSSRHAIAIDQAHGIQVHAWQMSNSKRFDIKTQQGKEAFGYRHGLPLSAALKKWVPTTLPNASSLELMLVQGVDSMAFVSRKFTDSVSLYEVTIQGPRKLLTDDYLRQFWSAVVLHRDTSQRALLYRLTKPGMSDTSYLFGTAHLRDRRVFAFGDSVLPALRKCKVYALESNFDSSWTAITRMMLTAELADGLDGARDSLGGMLFDRSSGRSTQNDASVVDGSDILLKEYPAILDRYLELTAISHGLKSVGLEPANTSPQRVKAFRAADIPDLLFGPNTARLDRARIIDLYRLGDAQSLYDSTATSWGSATTKVLLDDRNYVMANSFKALRDSGAVFMAVGSGHLGGDNGLIAILQRDGYKVDLIPTTHFEALPPVDVIKSGKPNWVNSSDGVVSAVLPFRLMKSVDLDSLLPAKGQVFLTFSESCDQYVALAYLNSAIDSTTASTIVNANSTTGRFTADTTIAGFPGIYTILRLSSGRFEFAMCIRMPTSYVTLRALCDEPADFQTIVKSIQLRPTVDTSWTLNRDTLNNFSFSSRGSVNRSSIFSITIFSGFGSNDNEYGLMVFKRFFNQVDSNFDFAARYLEGIESKATDTLRSTQNGHAVVTHHFKGAQSGILSLFPYRLKIFCLMTVGEGAEIEAEHYRMMSSIDVKHPVRGFRDTWTSPDSIVSSSIQGAVDIDYAYSDSTEYSAVMTDTTRMVTYIMQRANIDTNYAHEGPIDSLLANYLKVAKRDGLRTKITSVKLAGRQSIQLDYTTADSTMRQCMRTVLVGRSIFAFRVEGPIEEVNDTLLASIWNSIAIRDTTIDTTLFTSVLPRFLAVCDSLLTVDSSASNKLWSMYQVRAFKDDIPMLKAWIEAYFNGSRHNASVLARVLRLYVYADSLGALESMINWDKRANPFERSEIMSLIAGIEHQRAEQYIYTSLKRGDAYGAPVYLSTWPSASRWRFMYPDVLIAATNPNAGSTILNVFAELVDSSQIALNAIEPHLPLLIAKADSLEAELRLKLRSDSAHDDFDDLEGHITSIAEVCTRFSTNSSAQKVNRRVMNLPGCWPAVYACGRFIERGVEVDSATLGRLGVEDSWRYYLLESLEEKGRYADMPARHRTRSAVAKAFLVSIEELESDSVKIVYEQNVNAGPARGTWGLVEYINPDWSLENDSIPYDKLPLKKYYVTVGPFTSGAVTVSLPELVAVYPDEKDAHAEGDYKTQLARMLKEYLSTQSE